MEGDGEGLVAIVQGLENSGLTLTVCNRPRQNADRSRPSGTGHRIQINAVNQRSDLPAADQRIKTVPAVAATEPPTHFMSPAAQRYSAETSTGTDFSKMATASQICDGRYASSYKMAHCMVNPTSPPVMVTEFPPQRKEPCRNQGNFEIGGQGSAQWSGHRIGHNASGHGAVPARVSTSRVRHYGGTQTWADKGSSHRYSKSNQRETEAFAHSLRKYPSMAPFRTASTDLIEKLIRYTQAKNYQEMSRSTKSMRSLRHQKSSDTYETVKASKRQQTYTRRQDENVTINSNVQVGHRGRTKNSPISDRNLRENQYRDTTFSSSYDYLKAGNPSYGRSNRSDGSPSPTYSQSPERRRSPEESRSPDRFQNPDRSRSPDGSRVIRVDRSSKSDRPLRFERSVRDLSLSEMSRYIRSTIKQICNERPVVVQVCPKLKDRFNQHRRLCPTKKDRSNDVMEFEEEEEDPAEDPASGSVLSRFLQSFVGRQVHSTEQAGCQCTRTDCFCTKATQCVNNPDVATSTAACSCTTANTGCCRGMPCVCANKSQDQAYHKKRIDEEISEWLKDVPVTSIEESESKKRRETIIKELRKTLKQLSDDENFEENAANEIKGFIDDFPVWNPGKDENDEKLFKNQLADKLTEKIIAIPRKPDRFRDIVRKWIVNLDFEDDGEEIDMEAIIDNFVNRLKSMAADRPACDVKYTNILRKEIIELLVELALKFDGDMIMLKKMANNLAKEIVSIPRNVNLSGETDLTSEFEDNIADWICEHGLCKELKKDPKLIEGLAKKLDKIKSQGIYDDDLIEKMKEEVEQFVDDVGPAFETIDELIEELMNQLSSTIQIKEKERLDQEELIEEVSNWLRSLPGDDLHPRKLERITKDLVKMIQDSNEQENENLANDIVDYLVDAELSIDSADLGIYVEELMEKLNILPSNKFYKEQAKRIMLKDIFNIIECSPMPEHKKEKMKSKAENIVELNLRKSSLNLVCAPDNVKEILLQDMDNAVSDLDIDEKNRSQLKSLLSASVNRNFDKSFTRLSRQQSDLKQTIAKEVRKAVKGLPIDKGKKKELMQQVKGSLSKNMNKPLPSNIEDNINDGISDIVGKCPICEDRNVLGRIKKVLSEVASKYLTIYLPPCVCDIQNEVEEDVSTVIDKSSIDTGQKSELKESIQDILTDNEDRRLSDEVVRTIQGDISSVISDLSIPRDEKDYLKKAVNETVSKDFNEAGKAFRHDLNKIRHKLLDDITNVIENSPIQRDVKSHLKDKLNNVLAKNLDSSLSDKEKYMILDDVSNIFRDDMPEKQRISLTNKLAKKLDTHQQKEETKGLIETINKLSIDPRVKEDMKKEIKAIVLETLYNRLSDDVQHKIEEDIFNAIDEMDISEYDKNNLKSNISHAMAKAINKLISQDREEPQIKIILEKVATNEIKKSPISKDRKEVLENRIKDVLTENLVHPVTDDVKKTIKDRLEHTVDDLISDKDKADAIKTLLLTVVNKDLIKSAQHRRRIKSDESLRDQKTTMNSKEIDSIILEMERAVDEAPIIIPREKKNELKKKLKNIAIKNIEKPLDDVAEILKDDIYVIFNELNLPKDKKSKLKNALLTAVDEYMSDLQTAREDKDTEYIAKKRRSNEKFTYSKIGKGLKPIEEVDGNKVKDSILKGIEKIIDKSVVPEQKKVELKRKLKTLAAENLKKPFSQDVQDTIKTGMANIIDDLPISKSENIKLKSALTSIVDENVDDMRGEPRDQVSRLTGSADKPIYNIIKETDRAIEVASIPKEKKIELKKKLKNLAIRDFKKIPSEDVAEALEDDLIEIIDELSLPKDKKNKLKSTLLTAVGEYMSNLQTAREDKDTEYPATKRRSNEDSMYSKMSKGLKPIEEVDGNKVKDSILKGIVKIIDKSAVPEEKKVELKRKLKKVVAENFKKPFSENVQLATTTGIEEMLGVLPIPNSEKNKLKSELISMVKKNINNLIREPRDQIDISDELEDITLDNILREMERTIETKKLKDETKVKYSIFQGIEKVIEKSAVPEGKKTELKRKLKTIADENLKKPLSQDVQDTIKTGIADVIDDLPISTSEKIILKRELTSIVDENVNNLRGEPRDQVSRLRESPDKPLHNIIQEIDRAIEEASIPRGKKKELNKKLQNLATKDFKNIPSKGVVEALEDDLIEIIDELSLPKNKKNKLKSTLLTAVGEYMSNLQTARDDKDSTYNKIGIGLKPIEEVDASKVKDSILKGIEKIIDKSTVPEKKKVELKRKLKKVVAENFKKPFSEDVQEVTKTGIEEILSGLPISNSEKNKLKRELTSMVNKNINNLRSEPRDQVSRLRESADKPLYNFIQETDRAIEVASIPKEKKIELKKKLKNLATRDFKKIPSEDVAEALEDDLIEIIDELSLPKNKKNKLKSTLLTAVGEYMSNLQTARDDKDAEYPARKRRSNEDSTYNKIGIDLNPIEEVDVSKVKDSILKGIEKIIDKSTVPEKKNVELKRKLKKVVAENFKKPFSEDVQEATKNGIEEILGDLPISNSENNKLKSVLTSMVNKNLDKLRSKPRHQIEHSEELDEKPTNNIFREMELAIKDAPLHKDKKMELKKMLQDLATKYLENKSLDEGAEEFKDGMIEIIDELNLPKDKKKYLKSNLNNMIDENMDILQNEPSELPTQIDNLKEVEEDTQRNILKGFEKVTDETPIPKENMLELKKKLIDIATQNFKKPLSDEVVEALKDDINVIIDELNLPKYKKNRLKNALTAVVDENMSNYKNENKLTKSSRYQHISSEKRKKISYPHHTIDKSNLKESMEEEVKKTVLQSNIASSKKSKLNLDLRKMISDMLTEFDEDADKRLKHIFEKYGIKTNYQKTLNEEFDKLLEIALRGADFEAARRKLIVKLMRELNLSEEVASALTDEMIDIAREMAQKRDVVDIFKSPEVRPIAQETKDKITECQDAFAKAIINAVDQSTVSKPEKSSLKNKLLNKLQQTIDESPNKNNIGALKAQVLQECKKIVDVSSIPAGKKKEIKMLLKKELAKAFGDEITDDEESSDDGGSDDVSEAIALQENPTPEEYREKIIECIEIWMDNLPMDFDPEIVTAVAEDLAGDILDRQKYLQAHSEVISADNDEIENLKYQVFRRMNKVVDPKDMPLVIERTEELYRMVKGIEPPEGVPKLGQTSSKEQSSSQVPDKKRSTSATLSTGNINNSLKELIATNKCVRRQWSRHLDNALLKLPLLSYSETKDLKDNLAIYDETGQINILSALSTTKEDTDTAESSKSSKQVAPKPELKNDKGKTSAHLSKIEEAFAVNNTTKQKSPFSPNSNEPVDVKRFTKNLKDIINTWLRKAKLDIDQNEKNRILEELAIDIIERQKYLQTFEKTSTRSEGLEYLKLQIHRRLNGLVPIEELMQIIEKVKDLVPQIDNVKVPQLVQVPQKPPSRQVPQKPPSRQVPQKSPSPTQHKLGPTDIHSKATNTTTTNGVPHSIDDDDGADEELDTEFSPGQASTPSKSAAEQQEAADAEYFDKVIESVTNWLESMPIDLDPEVKSDIINDLTTDIVDRQKYLQRHPDKKYSDDEELENLRFQVFKRLDKVLEPDSSVTPSLSKIEELYKMIAGDGRKKSLTAKQAQEFRTALNEEISAILNNYHICCDKRELLPKLANELVKLTKSGADQDEIVETLIATIQPLTYLSDEDAEDLAYKLLYRTKKLIATIRGDVPVKKKDFKEAMKKDIGDVFEDCPMSQSKRRLMESQMDEGYSKDLGIPLEESNYTMNETGPESKKASYGMSFNGLSTFIDTWLSSIHSEDDETKDEDEILNEKREKMYCLVHKIGEMNVDPEIFNDDSLYEAVLREELQHLLGDIKMDEEEFQTLKEDLVEKVLEAQRRAHDEIAGQNYKKNLRDTLSKLLPDQRNLSREDQATIETLKDQLADAYIDLHYSGNNENQRDQLKRKITNEINTFCKDYLNRNPCSPLNSKNLNNELYTALNKVPLPPGDSIRYEVEQARIREEINDWVKELPLQPQSPTELLARNKMIYVLSKKLFDIEVEEQEEDEDNELMRKQIVRFLNKLPLETEEEYDAIADTLINKLKASEESRKYNAISYVTIDAFGNISAESNASSVKTSVCPGYKLIFDKRTPCAPRKVCARHPPRQIESIPPCTLSPEDRAHLEKIRRRTCLSPSCVTSLIKKHKCPTGAGPPPVDAGSQTVLEPFGIEEPQQDRLCPFTYEKMHRPCPRVSTNLPQQQYAQEKTESVEMETPQSSSICPAAFEKAPRICPGGPSRSPQSGQRIRRHTISSSNIADCNEGIQPQILIKQYYWDPCDKTSVDDSEQQQSGRSSRRIFESPPCHQPGPPPCHTPRPPCRPAPCGSPKPAPCSPPRPAPCSPLRPAPCRPAPCYSPRPAICRPPPSQSPRPAICRPPGACNPNPTCFSQLAQTCRRPSSAKLRQQSSPQPKSPRQNSSEGYSYCDPQNPFQKSSQRDIPSPRSPCSPSPCISSFGQYTPPGSSDFPKRFNECRMPKRDGLQDQVPSTSNRPSQKERVTELGSLDDVRARPKKRHSDQTDWPKSHEEDHFWTAPMRRVVLDQGIDESLVMESERREERVTCRCKERLVPKSGKLQAGNCPSQLFSQSNEDGQNLKRCSKCCGIHCPYPSFLYFRQ